MRLQRKHSPISGTPSVSIAIVQGNKIVYEKAYGKARPNPPTLYAAGELAMTAHDLALWDISLMERKLMEPYRSN